MASPRVRKIADRIKVIVAEMLERRIKDPRLGFVTVTDVRVSGDTQQATSSTPCSATATSTRPSRRHGGRAGVGDGADPLRGRQAARDAARADAGVHPRRPARDRAADRRPARPGAAVRRGGGRAATGATYAGEADPYKKPRGPGRPRTTSTSPTLDDARSVPDGLVVVDKPGGHDLARRGGTASAGWPAPARSGTPARSTRWPPACWSRASSRATRLLGTSAHRQGVRRHRSGSAPPTTTDDAEGEVVATTPTDGRRRGGGPRGARRVRRRDRAGAVAVSARSRSTASAPTSGSARARRSTSAARRSRSHAFDVPPASRRTPTCSTSTSPSRCSSGTYVRAHRPRPRRAARASAGTSPRCGAPRSDRSAWTGARTLDELADDLAVLPTRRGGPRCFPASTSTTSRPPTSASAASSTLDLGPTVRWRCSRPTGSFLALYEQQGELARAVAVFVVAGPGPPCTRGVPRAGASLRPISSGCASA